MPKKTVDPTSARQTTLDELFGRAVIAASKTEVAPQVVASHAKAASPKLVAVSKNRYRASAAERKAFGGNTVTEFYVHVQGDSRNTVVITGYGPTPGERKTNALRKGELALRQRGIIK